MIPIKIQIKAMSIIKNFQSEHLTNSDLVIKTKVNEWVIPSNAAMMKLLVEDQAIHPRDLQFASCDDCHAFIKHLLILALKDEVKNFEPSPLAKFARTLIHHNTKV